MRTEAPVATTGEQMPRRAALGSGAAVCLLALFAGLSAPALWEPDEPRFAEATRQMLLSGNFLTPRFNGEYRFEKPILFYWLQAPFFAVLGPTELAARLPAAVAGIGCVLCTFLIGIRLMGDRAAFVGALSLATLFRFVTYSRQGLTDVPALFFELVALYGFVRASDLLHNRGPRFADRGSPAADLEPGSGSRLANTGMSWALVAWTAIGFAAITKGPVAVLPVAIWLVFVVSTRDWMLLRQMHPVPGVLVAAVIAAPWYMYMAAQQGAAYWDVAFGREIAARVTATDTASRPFFYYFGVWPVDMLPWTPFFLAAVAYAAAARSRLGSGTRRSVLLLIVWFGTVVAVFTVSSGKLPHYLLPAYPAATLLCGLLADHASVDAMARRFWWTGIAVTGVALAAGAALVGAFLARVGYGGVLPGGVLLVAALAAAAPMVFLVGRRAGPAVATATLAGALAIIYPLVAVTTARLDGLQPIPALGRAVDSLAGPQDRVGIFGTVPAPGLVFYSRHDVVALPSPEDVAAFLQTRGTAFCVLPRQHLATVSALAPGAVHEITASSKLVVRFNRLAGRAKLYDDDLVLISNDGRTKEPSNDVNGYRGDCDGLCPRPARPLDAGGVDRLCDRRHLGAWAM